MAGGREYSQGQRKIIDRYYQNRDTIALTKLQEIVSELYLPEGKAAERLWKRAESHLKAADANPARLEKTLAERDPAALAAFVSDLAKR